MAERTIDQVNAEIDATFARWEKLGNWSGVLSPFLYVVSCVGAYLGSPLFLIPVVALFAIQIALRNGCRKCDRKQEALRKERDMLYREEKQAIIASTEHLKEAQLSLSSDKQDQEVKRLIH
jgi:hypothetical protein